MPGVATLMVMAGLRVIWVETQAVDVDYQEGRTVVFCLVFLVVIAQVACGWEQAIKAGIQTNEPVIISSTFDLSYIQTRIARW